MNDYVLEVKDLETHFFSSRGIAKAVDKVSYNLKKGEILGIVGESGCGKSVTALSVMQLIAAPHGKIVGGQVILDGEDLLQKSEKKMEKIRGNKISMIFQEPMTSLNPLYTVGDQILEPLMQHRKLKRKEAKDLAVLILSQVGIPLPEKRFYEYPNSLSGGMRQRVMIAIALSCRPEVMIADEPTTALDVTIQAQILDLMKRQCKEEGTAIELITHDLGVVAEMCDRAAVMYCGSIIEEGNIGEIFAEPLHPYTRGLMESIPRLDENRQQLYNIKGTVPSLLSLPKGCRFADRCEYCKSQCRESMPGTFSKSPTHKVRCHLYGGGINE